MEEISLKDLLEAGCHFGHKAERWHPKAAEFIFQKREGIHIIDLAKTKAGLKKAAEFIKTLVQGGGSVLFVGTKRQAGAIIKEEAGLAGASYFSHRWIGGFLTNWEQVHKNLEKIRRLAEEEKNNAWKKYPKHERVKLSRYLRKLEDFYGGVLALYELPKALVVVDIRREEVAVKEAARMKIPVVGIVDTNTDPTIVDFAIPANDDAVGSIKFIIEYLAVAFKEGRHEFEKTLPQVKTPAEPKTEIASKEGTAVQVETPEAINAKETDAKNEAIVAREVKEKVKEIVKPVISETAKTTKKRGRPKKK